jgi:hypothetical protein
MMQALARMYIDDWYGFIVSSSLKMALWFIPAFIATPIVLVRKKEVLRYTPWAFLRLLFLFSLLGSLLYSAFTIKWTLTRTLLDSENDDVAEFAYHNLFNCDFDKSINVAANGGEADNIRFYAACHVADLLAHMDEQTRSAALMRTEAAPLIKPQFFFTNTITYRFINPGYQEGPFYVSDIVKRRLVYLGAK